MHLRSILLPLLPFSSTPWRISVLFGARLGCLHNEPDVEQHAATASCLIYNYGAVRLLGCLIVTKKLLQECVVKLSLSVCIRIWFGLILENSHKTTTMSLAQQHPPDPSLFYNLTGNIYLLLNTHAFIINVCKYTQLWMRSLPLIF